MSKLKLLLLGGIFTLVGIFNFSSAVDYTITSDGNGYSPTTLNITPDYENITVKDFSCPSGYCEISLSSPYSCDIFYNKDIDDPISYDFEYCYMNEGNYNFSKTSQGFGYFDSITLSIGGDSGGGEGGEGGQIIPGGFDNFTPAVNGLHETVKQLIPLVIYLGIGILVVILGFIAIRWLVNWMSNGIKSKFTSKRG